MAIHRATSPAPSLAPLLPPSRPKVARSVRGGCPPEGDPGPRPWVLVKVVQEPSWKIWKSDWIIIPSIGENKNVPNHQPVYQQFKPPQPVFLLGGSLPHLAAMTAMTAMTGPEPEHVLWCGLIGGKHGKHLDQAIPKSNYYIYICVCVYKYEKYI